MEFLDFLDVRSLAVVEGVRICGIEVDKTSKPVWMAVCNRTQFRPCDRVSYQDRSVQFYHVSRRQHVIAEAVGRVLGGCIAGGAKPAPRNAVNMEAGR